MKYIPRLAFLLFFICSCSGTAPKVEETDKTFAPPQANINYEILSEEKLETSNKSQLIEYAFYKDSIYTREALENTVMKIFNVNQNKNGFKTHGGPTVVSIYLFTSKGAFKDKSEWIAMLSKGPNDPQPRISFNDFKITVLNNQNDNIKNKDEIELEELKSYLKKRGLDLCTLYNMIKNIELENIHKADKKYPDYGDRHIDMIAQLDALFYKNLKKKYQLNDNVLGKVSIFAMSYCK